MKSAQRSVVRSRVAVASWLAGLLSLTVASGEALGARVDTGFSGHWKPVKYVTELRAADGSAPPLLPQAQAVYDKNKATFKAGDTSFYGAHPCLILGQPRMNFIPYPIEIIDTPQRVAMLYEWTGYRQIDMSGKPPHVEYPLLNGYATGRRANGELVITTVGLPDTTFLDAAGMPHSEDLKITEHLRLLPGGTLLEDRMRFDDPKTFARPWDAVVTWKRIPGEWRENVCLERVVAGKPPIDAAN